jgi:hypothetical protein
MKINHLATLVLSFPNWTPGSVGRTLGPPASRPWRVQIVRPDQRGGLLAFVYFVDVGRLVATTLLSKEAPKPEPPEHLPNGLHFNSIFQLLLLLLFWSAAFTEWIGL